MSFFADAGLALARNIFSSASNSAVVDTVLQVIHRSIETTAQSLSGATFIWAAIFTNGINKDTMRFILDHLNDLFQFLYDLIKPGSVIPTNVIPGDNYQYNELDLQKSENWRGVINQVQRVALTFVGILKIAGEYTQPEDLSYVKINVDLSSDFDKNGAPPPAYYDSEPKEGLIAPSEEEWLFVNGIANEFTWFQRSCDKISDIFKRRVKGVYNRSDGILWDVIECALERKEAESSTYVPRTQSSKDAQAALAEALRGALFPPASLNGPPKVVMIAHSQGCLILRLVLQDFVNELDETKRNAMKDKLRVFTFANPSVDWQVKDEKEVKPLSHFSNLTEHFAHEKDFVARLGIVEHRSGYAGDPVYYSQGDRRGHLFGAHYALQGEGYVNGGESKLFKAIDGPIA